MVAEVYIFDAQTQAFHEAQSASVESFCHELGDSAHVFDDDDGFLLCEDDWQGFGFFGAKDVGGKVEFFFENVAVEEDDGAKGLTSTGSVQGFWEEAERERSVARWEMKHCISSTPMSLGWRLTSTGSVQGCGRGCSGESIRCRFVRCVGSSV